VTCLTVTGDVAEASRPGDAIDGGFLRARDDGPLVPGDLAWDLVADAPATCPADTVAHEPEHRVDSGNLTDHDAQPLPAHRERCRHGRDAAFGLRNQGQCVAFVQRDAGP
jgi:hypothetical protein